MDVDQSWILLRQKVFTEQHCPPELENIGKMIARNCKGLPLAIVVIAGILSTVSQTQASWEDIAKKVKGFMKPSVSKCSEEQAEEYLEDLVKRSLVLVTRRKSNGKIKSCNVHDLITVTKFPAEVFELFHLRYLAFTHSFEGSLPSLHVLEVIECSFRDCKWETTEGEFPQLKFLKINSSNLKHWVTEESSHFPSLERLLLYYCAKLCEIPDVIGEIPTLELIEVRTTRWNKPLLESAKRIKEEQQDSGNDCLQVRILTLQYTTFIDTPTCRLRLGTISP
ncbi:UNVERIFIED_CONTAM: ToMV susceptible protein tm-2 [Sesamum radiatum]|uniref:ToMV susceptible protein tm-2 n=1 Tax=Sesamum radiatum TaxID=300843 RepID=A0AAW2JVZ5_SESRA